MYILSKHYDSENNQTIFSNNEVILTIVRSRDRKLEILSAKNRRENNYILNLFEFSGLIARRKEKKGAREFLMIF